MTDALVFPPDVVVSRPFSSPEGAMVWLTHAANGDYGDFRRVVYGGFAGPWSLRPILTADLPETTVTITDPQRLGAGWSWLIDGTDDSVFLPVASDPNYSLPHGAPAMVITDPLPLAVPPSFLTWLYRVHLGYERLARSRFDVSVKGERVEWARRLGGFERAVERTGRQLVEACNRWVSTVWVDANNEGIPTVPDPQISDPDRGRNNGAGIPRLGSPME